MSIEVFGNNWAVRYLDQNPKDDGFSEYPELLLGQREVEFLLKDPQQKGKIPAPGVLHVIGNSITRDFTRMTGFVGAREIQNPYFFKFAYDTGKLCANLGGWPVTGGAWGVDTSVQEGALEAIGKSRESTGRIITVVAGGLDNLTGNADSNQRVLESGGTIVSEHHLGYQPKGFDFIKRNRYVSMAGRVMGIYVDINSGSEWAIRTAIAYGRLVGVYTPEGGMAYPRYHDWLHNSFPDQVVRIKNLDDAEKFVTGGFDYPGDR